MAKVTAVDPGFITSAPVSKAGMTTQLERVRDDINAIGGSVPWWGGVTTGGSTAYAVTVGIGTGSVTLTSGLRVAARLHITCGASPTLQFNSLTAKQIRRWNSATNALVALAANELLVGQTIDVLYNSVDDCWVLLDNTVGFRQMPRYESVGGNITVAITDRDKVYYSATATGRTLTLPTAASAGAGWSIKIVNRGFAGLAPVTVARSGGDTVMTSTDQSLVYPGEQVEYVSDGVSNWLVLGSNQLLRPIAIADAVSVAQVDFTLPIEFNAFLLRIVACRLATDAQSLAARTSYDNGATFDSGATDYTNAIANGDSTGATGALSSAAQLPIASAVDNTTTSHTIEAEILINPGVGASRNTQMTWHTSHQVDAISFRTSVRGGRRNLADRADAIRLLSTSGNIALGRFYLYGII